MEKIKVAEARVSGDWCNIKTPEGKEASIMLSKCPKLKAQIEANTVNGVIVPFELDAKSVEKNGKTYLWDVEEKKEGKGFKGQPRNEKAIISQSSWATAAQISLKQDFLNFDEIKALKDKIYMDVLKDGGIQ